MNIKKLRFLTLTLSVFLILLLKFNVFGYNLETECKSSSLGPGETLPLSFIIKGNEPVSSLEPFKCEIRFDSDKLKYKKISCKGNIKRTDIKVEKNEGILNLVYCPKKSRELFFSDGKSEIFETVFTVKNKVCSEATVVHTDFKGLNSDSLICSKDLQINIIGNPGMENCKLKSLTAGQVNLSPNFDPNVFEYSIKVSAETKNLDFNAVPMSEDLAVKISRRKLAAAGKATNIKITVSNKGLRIKSTYNIEVERESKDDLKKSEKNKVCEKAEAGTNNSTKVKDKKHKHLSKYDCTDIEDQDCDDKFETENNELENNSEIVDFKNDSFKVYLITAFCLILCAVLIYYIVKFIKSRKNLLEKSDNSINNNFEK